jgi:KDO2-lipid IV(A) lauroyltransferase
MLADYFYCSCRAPERADALLGEWHGKEHLLAARDGGKGAIVVTGHLGNWELGGILLALRGLPMTVVTLDEPSSALTAWRDAYRRRLGIKTIAVGPGREFAFVEMIQTLRRGECLAMLVDRPYPGTGAAVQLFGRQTEFSSGPALLWQHTGAPVVPAYGVPAEATLRSLNGPLKCRSKKTRVRRSQRIPKPSRLFLNPLFDATPNSGLTTYPSGIIPRPATAFP